MIGTCFNVPNWSMSAPHKTLHVVGESELAKHLANDQTDSYTENQIVCSVQAAFSERSSRCKRQTSTRSRRLSFIKPLSEPEKQAWAMLSKMGSTAPFLSSHAQGDRSPSVPLWQLLAQDGVSHAGCHTWNCCMLCSAISDANSPFFAEAEVKEARLCLPWA
jgi:hypothetical protein